MESDKVRYFDNTQLHPSLRRRAGDMFETALLGVTIVAVWLSIAAAAFAPIMHIDLASGLVKARPMASARRY
jgi:hypothetical protein